MPPENFSRRLLKLWAAPASWLLAALVLWEWVTRQRAAALGFALVWLAQWVCAALLDRQARRDLRDLQAPLAGSARVCREGAWQVLPAGQLAPGHQVHLRPGDRVPADVILLDGPLLVEPPGAAEAHEAAPGSPVAAGAIVLRGESAARVLAAGPKNDPGPAAPARPDLQPGSLQVAARRFDRMLLLAGGLGAALALAAGAALPGFSLEAALTLGGILLCAGVLAGSSAWLSAGLARGAQALWKGGGLVTRLGAIEDLAGLQVMIVEKAGLLTENSLALAQIQPFAPYSEGDVLHLAAMAAEDTAQNPEDRVILAQLQAGGKLDRAQCTAFKPYDPARRMSEAIYEEDGQALRVLKGAPAAILGLVDGNQADLYTPIHALAARGWRVTVVAVGAGAALHAAGLLAFQDPPRGESKPMIRRLRELGLKVVMSTGDSRPAAQAVACQMGFGGQLYPGDVLGAEPGELTGAWDVIAELAPGQKAGWVEAFRRAGIGVGITGDALADVPALRLAQVGVATIPAVDAARDAAGLVLARPHLSRLVESIETSREISQGLLGLILVPAARLVLLVLFLGLGWVFSGSILIPPAGAAAWLAVNQLELLARVGERGPAAGRWRAPRLGRAVLERALPFLALSMGVYGAGRVLGGLEPAAWQTLALVQLFLAGQGILYAGRTRGPRPGRTLLLFSGLQLLVVFGLAIRGLFLWPLPLAWATGLLGVNALVLGGVEGMRRLGVPS